MVGANIWPEIVAILQCEVNLFLKFKLWIVANGLVEKHFQWGKFKQKYMQINKYENILNFKNTNIIWIWFEFLFFFRT